ncbi:MAG: thioesterase family protein [Bacteroidota bacterium]
MKSEVKYRFQARWADLDPNGHMRHTAYNDYCAQARLMYFEEISMPFHKLIQLGVGPILFREETRFFKEIRMNAEFEVGFTIVKLRRNGSKWSFRHNIYTDDGSISAKVEVDGAWLDLAKRKTTVPPAKLSELLLDAAKSDDFEWIPDKVPG